MGTHAQALNIVVNFTVDGPNAFGVNQKPCIDCGNCVSGCNVGAKNTLYMNYLPMAAKAGATIFTQTKVEWLEKLACGRLADPREARRQDDGGGDAFTLDAGEVILSAGSLNSTEILLRSEMHGLSVSPALGTKFSGNGDFFGLAYNGDMQTNVLGYALGRTARPRRFSGARAEHRGRGPLYRRAARGPAHHDRRFLLPAARTWRPARRSSA